MRVVNDPAAVSLSVLRTLEVVDLWSMSSPILLGFDALLPIR